MTFTMAERTSMTLEEIQNNEKFPVLVDECGDDYANLELVTFNGESRLWVDDEIISFSFLLEKIENGYTIESRDCIAIV